VLAATLKCPIYLTFGLFFAPNRYQLHCEPLMDRVVLPRQTRAEALKVCVQQYASRLEHYCRLAPDNWFNFFDFWSESDA
jgi:predicted LPLAT superfamily acyltransferase